MTQFVSLFETVQDQSLDIASQFSNIISMVMPAFQAVFIVYCMFVIWSYWENESSIQGTFIDIMKRVIAWGLILGFGMNIGTYTSTVMPLVSEIGTDLVSGYNGQSTTDAGGLDNVATQLIKITETILEAAEIENEETANVAAGVESQPDTEVGIFGGAMAAVGGLVSDLTAGAMEAMFGGIQAKLAAYVKIFILWVFAIPFLGVALAYMLVAQVMLVFLAGIGPLFFGLALFPATRTYFTNWIGAVLNYGFYFLFVAVAVHLGLTIVESQLDGLVSSLGAAVGAGVAGGVTGGAAGAAVAAGAVLAWQPLLYIVATFVIFIVVILQIPSLTSTLFGGLAVGGFQTVARMTNLAGRAISSAAGSAGKAISSSKSGGSLTPTMKPENAGKK